MKLLLSIVVILASLFSTPLESTWGDGQSASIDYNFDIKPILSDRCYTCHGPDEENRQGGFRLDQLESATGEADSGEHPIVPGDPESSELISRITSSDPDMRMPPVDSNLSMTEEEMGLLRQWIEQGAEWKAHWSFLPLNAAEVQPVEQTDWPRNEIDSFVLAKLQTEGLSPALEANRSTLIRRLTYDLTGLPPTLEQIDAFEADKSPEAYEKLVDRLLASSRYGERMAVDWLDLARYADTYGYQEDRYRETWPWRDWVIKSFNENMPYDQFITWQLAGDLLPDATDEQILATAFNRLHRQTSEGGSVEEEFRTEYVVDRVDTFGAAFLGLTIGCARCHDHKFDPISQKEYYQLFAFFDNIDESGLYSYFTSSTPTPTMTLTTEEEKQTLKNLRDRIARAQEELDNTIVDQRASFDVWLNTSPSHTKSVGLIGDFSLDRLEGENVPNRAQPEQTGQLDENPKFVEGKHGKALKFSGENNFSTRVGGDFTRCDPFTISLWVKTPDVKDRAVIWHRSRASIDAGSRGYELLIEDGKMTASLVHFLPGNGIVIRTEQLFPIDQWVQVTVTYDGSSQADGLQIYWDGQPMKCNVERDNLTRQIVYTDESNEVDTNKVAEIAHQLVLGQRFRDRGFMGGLVDELKVYNRELSELEVASLLDDAKTIQQLIKKAQQRSPQETDQLYDYYLRNHSSEYAVKLAALYEARKAYADAYDKTRQLMVMKEMPEKRPTFLLARGAYDAPADPVSAATLDCLPPMGDSLPNNRLGLARWLTGSSQALTARVAVNRFWQSLFGEGLVATPLDFGSQGTLPTHPALLDWLSESFVESGWDVKKLMKTIVMSATYRQSSVCEPELRERDPLNTLLARGPRHRLSAEAIRDSALFTSGLLIEKIGGPPVKPYQPAGLWEEKGSATYERDKEEGSHRRSIYSFWKRTSPLPSMMTFDASDREVCVVKRQTTATPLQSLVLLNDPQYVEASRALADKLSERADKDIREQVNLAFEKVTSRLPTLAELDILLDLYAEQFEMFQSEPEKADEFLKIGDYRYQTEKNEPSLAALTVVVEAIMNLHESVTKQ
ncbi:DUF1553 domain-containing protein [Bythopirellula goksoeyrii]|uniref:Planctomycete cytochrome C n=1 Tax=Bythopirellula goksoeyrii TaxID=1400387 RepID=A0A5B9QAC5_9BACT|nr:DUF1553 domain-containing protein [Bythopirellula goksoeyrii]QEG34412.1 Planctomycete cytochrome C [Bythopirellula goksoeyrii]